MADFWESCVLQLEQDLPPQQVTTWIRPLRWEAGGDSGAFRLVVPNTFHMKWVKERYLQKVTELAGQFYRQPVTVEVVIGRRMPVAAPIDHRAHANSSGDSAESAAASPMTTRNTGLKQVGGSEAHDSDRRSSVGSSIPVGSEQRNTRGDRGQADRSRLIPEFTFDNLVVGKANDLARAAALNVAKQPGGGYNPLFVYGGAGLGKTHLIHAIGNAIRSEFPEKTVRYVHAEDYYTDVVRAYQQKSFDSFKRYYRSLDVLLVDDVQFFDGKTRSQEEFFFLFNALSEARKQIVLSSDTYPKDIKGLEDRLITRFDWGLTVQIEPPEIEMRVAILQRKAQVKGIRLDDEIAFFIAKHLRANVRELEGALNRLFAYAQFHNRAITLDAAKEALKDVIGAFNRQITIENIQKTVADYYKIKVADLFSKKRTRAIARPRQVAMWMCKTITPHSFPAIGEAFGGRDHTTVMHAVKNIESLKAKDHELNHDLHVLVQVVKG